MALLEVDKWKYVGVDWCKVGWFCVGLDDHGDYGFKVFRKFEDLLKSLCNAELILVDIPIGLPDGRDERECDRLARKKLGQPRGSSVFRVPIRKAVEMVATGAVDRAAVSSFQCQMIGKGISAQTFNITAKIAEVDKVMVNRKASGKTNPCVRETHPELCFWALNNRRAMKSKKDAAGAIGVTERLQVLRKFGDRTDEIYSDVLNEYLRKDVARDDVVDALAAAVTAHLVCQQPDGKRTAPANPPTDSKGLRMEMVYWLPAGARRA